MTLANPVHIAFIVAIALIFLGPKRLPELARGLGSGMREFRESLSGAAHHDEVPTLAADDETAQPSIQPHAPPPPGSGAP
ncbi:MAG TPA: twin-arginine translocase TatA/TatE family subunit [Solirubrobacteraceae bacterium]|nr:twin-arginine translocase TatA/TatE family subunit [Solirubrobacteraceae bacterium]